MYITITNLQNNNTTSTLCIVVSDGL